MLKESGVGELGTHCYCQSTKAQSTNTTLGNVFESQSDKVRWHWDLLQVMILQINVHKWKRSDLLACAGTFRSVGILSNINRKKTTVWWGWDAETALYQWPPPKPIFYFDHFSFGINKTNVQSSVLSRCSNSSRVAAEVSNPAQDYDIDRLKI